jgi:hypothetical protein
MWANLEHAFQQGLERYCTVEVAAISFWRSRLAGESGLISAAAVPETAPSPASGSYSFATDAKFFV